jgi:hypothetical protein
MVQGEAARRMKEAGLLTNGEHVVSVGKRMDDGAFAAFLPQPRAGRSGRTRRLP